MKDETLDFSEIRWIEFQDVKDARGRLTAIERVNHIPFEINRIFFVHQVASGHERGGHAHRDTDQVLAAMHGTLAVDISDGIKTITMQLDTPGRGIYVPRLFWIRLYNFSPDGVLTVFASTIYDKSKSIRTWADYLQERGISFPPAACQAKTE